MAAQGRLQYAEGTTTTPALTATFVAIVTLDCRDFNTMSLVLTNTSAAHSLKYKVTSKAHSSGQEYEEVASATLASNTMTQRTFTKKLSTLLVYAKRSTTSVATYQLDHIRGI